MSENTLADIGLGRKVGQRMPLVCTQLLPLLSVGYRVRQNGWLQNVRNYPLPYHSPNQTHVHISKRSHETWLRRLPQAISTTYYDHGHDLDHDDGGGGDNDGNEDHDDVAGDNHHHSSSSTTINNDDNVHN